MSDIQIANTSSVSAASTENVAANEREILFFDIDDGIYGMEIAYIIEIIKMYPITIVPRIPSFIKGVINLRGKVIPVLSMRAKFGKMEEPYNEQNCTIVIEWSGFQVGLIVDRVREVLSVPERKISIPPDHQSVNGNCYIKNIVEDDEGIKLLLDCQKLIEE